MKNIKTLISKILIWAFIMTMIAPLGVLALENNYVLIVDDAEYVLETPPKEMPLGIYIPVSVLANAFQLETNFDSENKIITLNDETNGEIILSHNASEYYHNGDFVECQRGFFVENGVPVIVVGFFCELYGADFEYDENNCTIEITRQSLEEVTEEVIEETSLETNEEPYHENEPEQIDISDDELDYDNGDLSSISNFSLTNDFSSLSGTISLPYGVVAPEQGIDVELKIILYSSKREGSLYGNPYYFYSPDNEIVLGTNHIDAGESSCEYSYDLSEYSGDTSYPNYMIAYELCGFDIKGEYDVSTGETRPVIGMGTRCGDIQYDYCYLNKFNADVSANISVHYYPDAKLSGTVYISNDTIAKSDIVIQPVITPLNNDGTVEGEEILPDSFVLPKGGNNVDFNIPTGIYCTEEYPYYKTNFIMDGNEECVVTSGHMMESQTIEQEIAYCGTSDISVSGIIKLSDGFAAPAEGLKVNIKIVPNSDPKQDGYYGNSYYRDDAILLGEQYIAEGENSFSFGYSISEYSGNTEYPYYMLVFEIPQLDMVYLYNAVTKELVADYVKLNSERYLYNYKWKYDYFNKFDSGVYIDGDIYSIPYDTVVSGTVSLPEGMVAPEGGITVEIEAKGQKRVGGSYEWIDVVSVGECIIPENQNSVNFSFIKDFGETECLWHEIYYSAKEINVYGRIHGDNDELEEHPEDMPDGWYLNDVSHIFESGNIDILLDVNLDSKLNGIINIYDCSEKTNGFEAEIVLEKYSVDKSSKQAVVVDTINIDAGESIVDYSYSLSNYYDINYPYAKLVVKPSDESYKMASETDTYFHMLRDYDASTDIARFETEGAFYGTLELPEGTSVPSQGLDIKFYIRRGNEKFSPYGAGYIEWNDSVEFIGNLRMKQGENKKGFSFNMPSSDVYDEYAVIYSIEEFDMCGCLSGYSYGSSSIKTISLKTITDKLPYDYFDGDVELYNANCIQKQDIILDKWNYAGNVNNRNFEFSNGKITKCNINTTEITIPSVIDGIPVTAIGVNAFSECNNLTRLVVPEGINKIHGYAFQNCKNLSEIFYKGTADQWSKIDIGGRNEYLSDAKIYYSYGKNDDIVGSGVCGETSIWSLDNKGTLTISGYGSVCFDSSDIPWKYFVDKVVNVIFSEGIEEIYDNALVFYESKNIETVTISKTVTGIFAWGFNNCENLKAIYVNEDNDYYCSVDGVLFNNAKTKLIQYPSGKTDVTYTIPDGVTEIAEHAFEISKNLVSINIPASVSYIGNKHFLTSCSKLNTINVDDDNQWYCSIDGNLLSKDKTIFLRYAPKKTNTKYTVPDGVVTIDYNAFACCTNLNCIEIPNGVKNIHMLAFQVCNKLESIYIPKTLISVGMDAFIDCNKLSTIYYEGTATDWQRITINNTLGGNSSFKYATKVYNSSGDENDFDVDSGDTDGDGGSAGGGGGSAGGGGATKPVENPKEDVNEKAEEIKDDTSNNDVGTNTKPMKFTDVKENDWYHDAVSFAYEKGITSGTSESSFSPNDKVTRGQFITMLCRAYEISEMSGDNFSDAGNTWYTGYLAAAKQLGISNGVGGNKFEPEKNITREEMVTLIYNYLKSIGDVDKTSGTTDFADEGSISDWADESVAYAYNNGIVSGKGNNIFDPKGNATRAELAQIFFNMLK